MEKEKEKIWKSFFTSNIRNIFSLLFQKQETFFVMIFVVLSGFGIWIWYENLYLLGRDAGRIENMLKEKDEIQFNEKLYDNIKQNFDSRKNLYGSDRDTKELFIKKEKEEEK
ncbi:MAG: hypothetical protein IPN70_03920 [Candidatus Moraniibacteriota bacterium]|nr:MAG: hypothetical protein IPN70_03920 [Candidatus Moranbacteria bacterium]